MKKYKQACTKPIKKHKTEGIKSKQKTNKVKMPKLSPMRQNMSEYSVVLLLCCPYPAGHGASFKCGLYTQ